MFSFDELAGPLEGYLKRAGSASPAPPHATPGGEAVAVGDDWRFDLVRSIGEECQTDPELRSLLQKKQDFIMYDGFEPSGRMHIAQGIFKSINVNKCTKAGGTFIFWVADWFALMNDKMGGDLDKIKTVGSYLIEVWKASGMDMSRVKFLWSSDEISNNAKAYWGQALDIARKTTLPRIKKCCQIMGRKEDKLTAAQILYPVMQCTDIFFLTADVCQLGVDQRKVNMLARYYCDVSGRKVKPVVLSHHMLFGLKAGQAKMSKSDPDSAIFMEDSADDVARKIRNAYCPTEPEAGDAVDDDDEMHLVPEDLKNPCLDYVKHILFSKKGFVFEVGGRRFSTFEDVKQSFVAGEISERALKDQLIVDVNSLLEPVRQHFKCDPTAKELLAKLTQWKKENLVAPPSLRRLNLISPKSAPVFAVFAPQPSASIQLEDVLGVLARLQLAPPHAQVVLWLEDWTSMTLDRLGGSTACIHAFYEILLHGLKSVAPELMQRVRICWQGEMILVDPSEYWISVINVGRRCSVEEIRTTLPAGEDLEHASQVFAALMHVGDVLALSSDGVAPTLSCDAYHENLHRLAAQQCESCGLEMPKPSRVEAPRLRLMQDGEGIEADVNITLTDKDTDVNRKVKKAFCEPGNAAFCPTLDVVAALFPYQQEFTITRKPENGGDKTYTDLNALRKDFGDGNLHPGDLKPAVSKMLNVFLDRARVGLKSIDALKAAQKEMDAFTKGQKKK